jgi:hypothetical protein
MLLVAAMEDFEVLEGVQILRSADLSLACPKLRSLFDTAGTVASRPPVVKSPTLQLSALVKMPKIVNLEPFKDEIRELVRERKPMSQIIQHLQR